MLRVSSKVRDALISFRVIKISFGENFGLKTQLKNLLVVFLFVWDSIFSVWGFSVLYMWCLGVCVKSNCRLCVFVLFFFVRLKGLGVGYGEARVFSNSSWLVIELRAIYLRYYFCWLNSLTFFKCYWFIVVYSPAVSQSGQLKPFGSHTI